MSNVNSGRWSLATVIRVMVTVVLGGIGAAAGFKHTHDWAVHHGQTGWLAWADAVVIEGMAVVAGFEIHRDRQRNPHGRAVSFPLVVLVVAFGIQMTAQVALAEPTPAGWLLAAMPALGFLVVVKLLMRRIPHTQEPTKDTPPSDPQPEPPAETPTAVEPATEPTTTANLVPSPDPAPRPVPRVRLPAEVLDRVTAAIEHVRSEGRQPTPSDVQQVVRVPEEMAQNLLADLDDRNGYPVLS